MGVINMHSVFAFSSHRNIAKLSATIFINVCGCHTPQPRTTMFGTDGPKIWYKKKLNKFLMLRTFKNFYFCHKNFNVFSIFFDNFCYSEGSLYHVHTKATRQLTINDSSGRTRPIRRHTRDFKTTKRGCFLSAVQCFVNLGTGK